MHASSIGTTQRYACSPTKGDAHVLQGVTCIQGHMLTGHVCCAESAAPGWLVQQTADTSHQLGCTSHVHSQHTWGDGGRRDQGMMWSADRLLLLGARGLLCQL
jgi:hypothetical protein